MSKVHGPGVYLSYCFKIPLFCVCFDMFVIMFVIKFQFHFTVETSATGSHLMWSFLDYF